MAARSIFTRPVYRRWWCVFRPGTFIPTAPSSTVMIMMSAVKLLVELITRLDKKKVEELTV